MTRPIAPRSGARSICSVRVGDNQSPNANSNIGTQFQRLLSDQGPLKALTDEGFPLDFTFITGAVKKALKSTAITCDEGGENGQWVIHTKRGGWIVNCQTRQKIPFKRQGNTYYIDAWVKLPKKSVNVDSIDKKSPGFTRPSCR